MELKKFQTISQCIKSLKNKYSHINKFKINENIIYKVYSIDYELKLNNTIIEDYFTIMNHYHSKNDFIEHHKDRYRKNYTIFNSDTI